MGLEIERKFLVIGEGWKTVPGAPIRQGYLSCDAHRIVRVRVSGDSAWICVKGIATGATRAEFEYPIPRSDGDALLELCEQPLVEKVRYRVEHAGHCWEIDEFLSENSGLVVAEVELKRADEPVAFPPWIGAEVTHDPRYYNVNLVANPYQQWPKQGKAEK